MNPIDPWLDPIKVRALADQLLRPLKLPVARVPDVGFGDAFVGFASHPSFPEPTPSPMEAVIDSSPHFTAVAEILRKPEPAQEPVSRSGPPSSSAEVEEITNDEFQEPATPAHEPFLERIHPFRDWMHHQFNATDIFILDREGAVIFDESNHGRLHFVARSLAHASRRPGATVSNVHVKIRAGTTLEVIPVETVYGCLVLGAVVPESMDLTAVAAVMKALSEIASGHSGS